MNMNIGTVLRIIGAILAGIAIASCVIVLFEAINTKLYPSEHLEPTMKEIAEQMETLPLQAFLIVLLGYILSSFFGGYTAARISPIGKKDIAAFCVGFFLLLGGIVNFFSVPHPFWFSLSASVSFILFSFLGGKLASRNYSL